jgi:hypothetical protein
MQTARGLPGAGLLALALVAVGCGGSGDVESVTQAWEVQCCKVTGGGVEFVEIDGVTYRFTFGFNVIPTPPGIEGHITLQVHGTEEPMEFCDVTSIECDPDTESALFRGTLRSGGQCVVTVDDNGEPGRDDTIAFTGGGFTFGPIELEQGGNIQFHKPNPAQCPAEDNTK